MNDDLRVAILISTMNRPEFLIRTLNYYAKIQSPHPVYLSDSSNPENAKKITQAIERLKGKLEVHYNWYAPGLEVTGKTLARVKEKYAVINGDDDYEISSTLTKAAEFLENNPEYIAAGGHGISFRLKTSGPYGEIKKLADYPNYSLEADSAAQRLIDFLKKCYVITFSVNRVDHLKKIWVVPLPIISTWSELFQNCFCAVSGKVKLMDCLGVVRQIHDKQYYANLMVDWLTEKGFHDYYTTFRDHLAKKIMELDKINQDQANQDIKRAFWEYLQVYMANEQKALNSHSKQFSTQPVLKAVKIKIGKTFPVLKTLYRRHFRPIISDRKQMHYEVTNPNSSYYKDFKPIWNSFSEKD